MTDQEVLADVRRDVVDAQTDIARAVASLENAGDEDVMALLGEVMSRLKIVDQRIGRYLGQEQGSGP